MTRRVLLALVLVSACDATAPVADVTRAGSDAANRSADHRPSIALAFETPNVVIEQGQSATVPLAVTRVNFPRDLHLALGAIPPGLTATLGHSVLSDGATATSLSLSAAADAPVGAVSITVTGTANGIRSASASQSIEIVVPPPKGTVLTLDFCAGSVPLWFAYRNDGEEWTQLVPDGNGTVSFLASDRVTLGITHPRGQTPTPTITTVLYTTAAELLPLSGMTCVDGAGSRDVSGVVTGVTISQRAYLAMWRNTALPLMPAGTYSHSFLPDAGPLDLIAIHDLAVPAPSGTRIPNAFIIRRGLDFADGATLAPIDFASPEAFAPATGTYAVEGTPGISTLLVNRMLTNAPFPGTRAFTQVELWRSPIPGAAGTYYAVPGARTVAGDMQQLVLTTQDGSGNSRGITAAIVPGQHTTLAIGQALATPTHVPVAVSPSVRYSSSVAMGEYTGMAQVTYSQGVNNTVVLEATRAWFDAAASDWVLEVPDLSGVAGWQPSWGLQPGTFTNIQTMGWSVPWAQVHRTIPRLTFGTAPVVKEATRRVSVTTPTSP